METREYCILWKRESFIIIKKSLKMDYDREDFRCLRKK